MKLKNVKVLALLILGFVACNPAEVIQPPPESPPAVIPPPAGLTGPVLAALYDGATVRLWDGVNAVDWKTGAAVKGNGCKIAVGRTLYFLDASGAVISTMNLPANPAGVAVVGDPDVYTFEDVPPDVAYAAGAHYTHYTRIWKNGAQLPANYPYPENWMENQWKFDHSFEAANGDVVAVDDQGHFWDISRPTLANSSGYQPILWAWEGGPIFVWTGSVSVNGMDVYDAGHPSGHPVVWTGGNSATKAGEHSWTEFPPGSGVLYSAYGDRWDGTTFAARSTPMIMWVAIPSVTWQNDPSNVFPWPQNSPPTVIYAYQDTANMYWVECNTGILFSWTVQTGVISRQVNPATWIGLPRLYLGDGAQGTGISSSASLSPELIDGQMYFHAQGTLWRMDTASTIISSFSADQKLWVMR